MKEFRAEAFGDFGLEVQGAAFTVYRQIILPSSTDCLHLLRCCYGT